MIKEKELPEKIKELQKESKNLYLLYQQLRKTADSNEYFNNKTLDYLLPIEKRLEEILVSWEEIPNFTEQGRAGKAIRILLKYDFESIQKAIFQAGASTENDGYCRSVLRKIVEKEFLKRLNTAMDVLARIYLGSFMKDPKKVTDVYNKLYEKTLSEDAILAVLAKENLEKFLAGQTVSI